VVKIYRTSNRELVLDGGEIIEKLRNEYAFELEKGDDSRSIIDKLFLMCRNNTYVGSIIPRVLSVNYGSMKTHPRHCIIVRTKELWDEEVINRFIKQLLEEKDKADSASIEKTLFDELGRRHVEKRDTSLADAQKPSKANDLSEEKPTTEEKTGAVHPPNKHRVK